MWNREGLISLQEKRFETDQSSVRPGVAAYQASLIDWLACAKAGAGEPVSRKAAQLGNGLLDQVLTAGVSGHVLDFDDTYAPGLVHISAIVAPAALVTGAHVSATLSHVLDGYAEGFETMAAVSEASHPRLYEGGWHSTAVCGVVGAARAASHILSLDEDLTAMSLNIALLSASGLQAAFGSDGKSLQVGMAASAGVRAALLAKGGATVANDLATAPRGFVDVYGAGWGHALGSAISRNWIKAYPSCLMTHSAIEASCLARERGLDPTGGLILTVHPRARQAAAYDDVSTGTEAKFSIPYTAAFALLHGSPSVSDFQGVDEASRALSAKIEIRTATQLPEFCAVMSIGDDVIRIDAALGSPDRPMGPESHSAKLQSLDAQDLLALFDDESRTAEDALTAAGIGDLIGHSGTQTE